MIGRRTFLAAVAGALLLAAPAAQAGPQTLTEQVKANLIGAKPLNDKGVTRETFNGKPLLVIYFASW